MVTRTTSLFDFWAQVPGSARVHPADAPIFARFNRGGEPTHGFDLRCLPSNIDGPLKTARVVLLYLSPGMDERDIEEADWPESQRKYAARPMPMSLVCLFLCSVFWAI